ncbi:spermidine/spermine N(1)-acetyltransferase-like protein 1 isoform X4 [Festucalex cinctus]
MNFNIRAASQADCKDISRMLMDLAVHDNMLDQVEISCEDLQRDGFSQNPSFECIVAEVPEENKSKEGKIISRIWHWNRFNEHRCKGGQREAVCAVPVARVGQEHSVARLLCCKRRSGSHGQGRLALNTFSWAKLGPAGK